MQGGTDRERQRLLAAVRRDEQKRSRAFARTLRLRAALDEAWHGDDGVVLELAGTARIGQARAATQLLDGARMAANFPRALDLLEAGVLRQGTAELLLRVTRRCTDAVQEEVGRRLLDRLVELDAADARRLLLATIPEVEADLDLAERERAHARAKADRGVWVKPVEDGMAVIGATTDQLSAHRFLLDLEELVRAEGAADAAAGIVRSKAQRRADVLAELPTRHLALLRAVAEGKADALLAEALAAVPAPSCDELPLGLPAGRTPAWGLPPDDLVVALLGCRVRGPSLVYVHTAMTTLLELDHRSGYVEGLGPVPAYLVRLLVPDAGLRRVAVNGRTGLPYGIDPALHPPIDVTRYAGHGGREGPSDPSGGSGGTGPPRPHDPSDPTLTAELERERLLRLLGPLRLRQQAEPRHDPSRRLRRLVEVRDLACTGPGCSRSARACDLDHRTTYAEGGPTAAWNLDPKSRRCHLARHAGWTVESDGDSGITTWRSPEGSTYVRRSPWQPHRPLDDDLVLPLPRLAVLPDVERDRPDVDELPPVLPPPPPPPVAAPSGGWGSGPAPF